MRCLMGNHYVPGGYIDYGFSNLTLLSEINQFSENKNPNKKEKIRAWEDELRLMLKECETYLNSVGCHRVDPNPALKLLLEESDPLKLWEVWEKYILMATTDGTSGGWLKYLFPGLELVDTKQNVYQLFIKCVEQNKTEKLSSFFSALRRSFLQLRRGDSGSVLVHVFPKNEPVKEKKLLEGRHRSIQMPEWTYTIIERCCCAWKLGDEYLTHDQAYALCGRSEAGIGGWVFGYDVNDVLHQLGNRASVLDLDVSGWDKSLPFELVDLIYQLTFHPSTSSLAATCAKGYNGFGIFKIGAWLYKLPPGSSAWSSGCPNTLCGNSQIHSALLRSAGSKDHIVMGDDANVTDLKPETLTELYRDVGLKLKKIDSNNHWFFCKRTYIDGVIQPDWGDIMAKMQAKIIDPKVDRREVNLMPMMQYYREEWRAQAPLSVDHITAFKSE